MAACLQWLRIRPTEEPLAPAAQDADSATVDLARQLDQLRAEMAQLKAQNAALKLRLRAGADAQAGGKSAAGNAAQDKPTRRRVPTKGDAVISHHRRGLYYTARIVAFNAQTREFEVLWDDGDTTDTHQPFEKVCLDLPPEADDVGVGSKVIFPYGTYRFGGTGGHKRYFPGTVTEVWTTPAQQTQYLGVWDHDPQKRFAAPLEDLRVCANLLDLVEQDQGRRNQIAQDQGRRGQNAAAPTCDIFFAYMLTDAAAARRAGPAEAAAPPELAQALESEGWRVHMHAEADAADADLSQTIAAMSSARVVVVCLSDAFAASPGALQCLQYSKKSLHKDVVPVIVGRAGESWDFMQTLVGLLIAGDLYIDTRQRDLHTAKVAELTSTVRGLLERPDAAGAGSARSRAVPTGGPGKAKTCDVFLSYCWANSQLAHANGQVPELKSKPGADPRALAAALRTAGHSPWLDIEMLGGGSGLFGDIARGLKHARVVVACVSSEYAASENCTMELQYALKLLKKPAVVVVVGEDDRWRETVVGLLTAAHPTVDLSAMAADATGATRGAEAVAQEVKAALLKAAPPPQPVAPAPAPPPRAGGAPPGASAAAVHMSQAPGVGGGGPAPPRRKKKTPQQENGLQRKRQSGSADASSRAAADAAQVSLEEEADADSGNETDDHLPLGGGGGGGDAAPASTSLAGPRVGDHVVSKYVSSTYYPATVIAFDAAARTFKLRWDDGDSAHTEQPFESVALDRVPDSDDVGVGSAVIYKSGTYRFHGRDNQPRFRPGTVTAVHRVDRATLGLDADGGAPGTLTLYTVQDDEVSSKQLDLEIGDLRVAGNLMAALDAQLESWGGGDDLEQPAESAVFDLGA